MCFLDVPQPGVLVAASGCSHLNHCKLKFQESWQIFVTIQLMEEILHQLIGILHHYLQGLYIPGGAGFLPSTIVVK